MLSKDIETILDIFKNCQSWSEFYEGLLSDCEAKESDIKHELEGFDDFSKNSPPKYKHRAKLATQLQKTLLKRREAKDYIYLCKPIIDFINSEVGVKAINILKLKLGDIRKIEKNMSVRRYYKRSPGKNKTK